MNYHRRSCLSQPAEKVLTSVSRCCAPQWVHLFEGNDRERVGEIRCDSQHATPVTVEREIAQCIHFTIELASKSIGARCVTIVGWDSKIAGINFQASGVDKGSM